MLLHHILWPRSLSPHTHLFCLSVKCSISGAAGRASEAHAPLGGIFSTRVVLHGSKHSKHSCHLAIHQTPPLSSPEFTHSAHMRARLAGGLLQWVETPSWVRASAGPTLNCCIQQLPCLMACWCDSLDMTFVCLPAYSYFVQLYFILWLRFIYFFKSLLTCCQSKTKRLIFTVLGGRSQGIHGSHYSPEMLVLVAYAVFLAL